MTSVQTLFQTIKSHLSQITETFGPSDEPGTPATEVQITELEAFVGTTLPVGYKEFLRLCDGWSDLGGMIKFLSIEEIVSGDYNEDMDEIAEETGFAKAFILAGHLEEDSGICLLVDEENHAFLCDIDEGVLSEPTTFASLLQSRKEMLLEE